MEQLVVDSPLAGGPPVDSPSEAAEQLTGVRMTREWAQQSWDSERDEFSQRQRLTAWDRLDARHHENKQRIKIPYRDFVLFMSGDRGCGKTNIAALMGAHLYEQGVEVFSSASLLFGYRIDPLDVFTMAESLPDNCYVFLDEVHGLADRYAENSTRQRTLSNSLALLRKKGIRLVMASTHEERVAFSLKSQVHTLIYPRQYKPRWKKMNGQKFPQWCYVRCSYLGPSPFEGKRMSDQWGIPRTGGRCRRVERPPIPARQLYEAAKLMDTWQKPSIAQGIETTAAQVKKRLAGEEPDQEGGQAQYEREKGEFMEFLGFLAEAINRGFELQPTGKNKTVEWKIITNAARERGWPGVDKQARLMLKSFVSMNSQYKVPYDALMKWFRPQPEGSGP